MILDPMIAFELAGLVVSPASFSFEGCAGLAGAEPQEWGRDQLQNVMFVGLDVHKATIRWRLRKVTGAAKCGTGARFRTAPYPQACRQARGRWASASFLR